MCNLFPPTNQTNQKGEANREAQQFIQQATRYSPEATSGLAALLSAGLSGAVLEASGMMSMEPALAGAADSGSGGGGGGGGSGPTPEQREDLLTTLVQSMLSDLTEDDVKRVLTNVLGCDVYDDPCQAILNEQYEAQYRESMLRRKNGEQEEEKEVEEQEEEQGEGGEEEQQQQQPQQQPQQELSQQQQQQQQQWAAIASHMMQQQHNRRQKQHLEEERAERKEQEEEGKKTKKKKKKKNKLTIKGQGIGLSRNERLQAKYVLHAREMKLEGGTSECERMVHMFRRAKMTPSSLELSAGSCCTVRREQVLARARRQTTCARCVVSFLFLQNFFCFFKKKIFCFLQIFVSSRLCPIYL